MSEAKQEQKKQKSKIATKIILYLAMLLSGITTIFIVSSIVVASVSTRALLEYKGNVNISYQNTQPENRIVNQVKKSIWAKWPKWLIGVVALLIGVFSVPAFFLVFCTIFGRTYEGALLLKAR